MIAQIVNNNPRFWSWGDILIGIVVVAAAIAIVVIALKAFGLEFPWWAKQVLTVVVVAVVVILALRFILSL